MSSVEVLESDTMLPMYWVHGGHFGGMSDVAGMMSSHMVARYSGA